MTDIRWTRDKGDGCFGERESSNLATNMANQIEKMAGSDVFVSIINALVSIISSIAAAASERGQND